MFTQNVRKANRAVKAKSASRMYAEMRYFTLVSMLGNLTWDQHPLVRKSRTPDEIAILSSAKLLKLNASLRDTYDTIEASLRSPVV